MNEQQKYVFDTLMKVTNDETGRIYFLDAPGGTGKTFLISLILATIHLQNKIALGLASSGIAATLLKGGRTAHLALKLSLNMQSNETPTCNISKKSEIAKVLQQCELRIYKSVDPATNQDDVVNYLPLNLAIKKLVNNVIEATILKGKYKEDVLIPRIPMIPLMYHLSLNDYSFQCGLFSL
ncbi:unnamed protein product [Psylliodes chrysocephalus]|uniref:ATP-dependent DNA helicase n=1 Tax=Psylliodes chrysocephalus TaxID=3402493 RepID=A0A9P0CPI5_9CUCU|nr:unnamed protein product [Psylliodes chrysocephala]